MGLADYTADLLVQLCAPTRDANLTSITRLIRAAEIEARKRDCLINEERAKASGPVRQERLAQARKPLPISALLTKGDWPGTTSNLQHGSLIGGGPN